jgi:hypothetical protein
MSDRERAANVRGRLDEAAEQLRIVQSALSKTQTALGEAMHADSFRRQQPKHPEGLPKPYELGLSDEDEHAYYEGVEAAIRAVCNTHLAEQEIVKRLIDAQAELQTGLGMYRLHRRYRPDQPDTIEGYLERSLKMQQRLLALLGSPMAGGPDGDVEPQS